MDDGKRAAIETVEFVTRSTCRVRLLETLLEAETVSRTTLRDEVDVVRTTLQRNLEGLEKRGLIRERNRSYEITPAGALAASGIGEALRLTEPAIRLRPVLERVSLPSLGFDLERLADATVVEATTANPYAPVKYHQRTLADADHVRLVLPATGADPLGTSREAVEEGATHEAIVTPSVAETLRTDPSVAEEFEAMVESDDVAYSVYDGDVPFYLGIVDDAVQIGVHDESGLPTALLESTDERVREWAIDRFEEYERRSERRF